MMGLLKKASLLSKDEEMLDFFTFCNKNNFTHYAKLNKFSDRYFVCESYGFDYESLLKSYSTVDFWNGTIPEPDIYYTFENQNFNSNPLLQFFSQKIQKDIKTIYVKKSGDNIYINCDNQYEVVDYLDKNEFVFKKSSDVVFYNEYKIDLTAFLNQLIISNISIDLQSQKTALFFELKNIFLRTMKSLNSFVKFDGFNVSIFLSEEMPDYKIIEKQLNLTLKDFYNHLEPLKFEYNGKVLATEEFYKNAL